METGLIGDRDLGLVDIGSEQAGDPENSPRVPDRAVAFLGSNLAGALAFGPRARDDPPKALDRLAADTELDPLGEVRPCKHPVRLMGDVDVQRARPTG